MGERDSSPLPERLSARWAREMQRYSAYELQGLLGIADIGELRDAVDKLHDANILRTIRKGSKQEENAHEDENDPWDKQHLESYTYRFHYVGILQYGQSLLYVLPKYCDEVNARTEVTTGDPRWEPFKQVMRVIEQYEKSKRALGLEEDELPWDDTLHVMVELVSDYVENGVYRDDEHVDEINGKGRILWQRTIQKTLPFIQDGEPIYMELHTRRKQEDDQNFFTRMHHYLAHRAWEMLHAVSLDSLLSLPDIPAPEDSDSDFSERDYMLDRIHAELSQQFDSRRRYLLQLMERYLSREEESFSDGFHTFGKTEFHTVWEEACRVAFDMEKSTPEQMEASKPHWQFGDNEDDPGKKHDGDPLVADMVKVDGRMLTILDAKYYVPDSSKDAGKIVADMPKIQDIIKQQLYELALRKKYPQVQEVVNAFILPFREEELKGDCEEYMQIGSVKIPMLSDLIVKEGKPKLKEVVLIKYPPQTIWDAYLKHGTIQIPKGGA